MIELEKEVMIGKFIILMEILNQKKERFLLKEWKKEIIKF